MARRRRLARLFRRLSRPTLGRLIVWSLVLHAGVFALLAWVVGPWAPPPPLPPLPRAPLIVELPPAAPGPPLVRPEGAAPAPRSPAPAPPVVAARPAGPARPAAPSPTPPAPAPAVQAPAPPAPPPQVAATAPVPEPSPPPPPARVAAPEPPAPPTPPEPAPAPEVAARPPEPAPASPVPPAAARPPEPAPTPLPPVAARPPEPTEGRTPTGPAAGRPAAPAPGGAEAPRESILSGQGFSLLGSRLEVPLVASLPSSGTGGTSQEGSGSGSTGRERDGQPVVPLDTPDPRYADYFLEIKRRIEANWVYPQEAIRRNQSGQGVVEFVLRKDGSLRLVEIVHSSGVAILDRYMENAIKFAAPFPPMPTVFGTETIPVSLSFTYVLGGFRVFGFR